ncbi:MAG: hypothetical protein ACTH2Q_11365 [Propionibacteriaceae bacterium]
MVPIAIVVILIVIVFTVALLLAPDPATLSIFGAQINTNTTGVYFTGAVTMLVLLVSLLLLRAGISRSVRHRKEVRSLKKQAEVGTGASAAPDQEPTRKADKQPGSKADKGAARKGHRRSDQADTKTSAPASEGTAGRAGTPEAGTTTPSERASLLDETDSLLGDERDR